MSLSERERERYRRQMMMEGWGEGTQRKLGQSTVFVAGAGGLGSPVAIYLAVAGVGHIKICDFDAPEYSNLNRQILHDPTRIGINKALSAQITLRGINPDVEVTAITEKITAENADRLIGDAAIVMDCMDNLETRYVLNATAMRKQIPMVHGAIWGIDGRLTFIQAPQTPCLQCVIREAPPKEVFPVLGATPGVIGSLQVVEAIKYLTGIGEPLRNEVLLWDGALTQFSRLRLRHDPECPTCGSLARQTD